MKTFHALHVHQADNTTRTALENLTLDDLGAGEVVIRAHFSSLNYKDALAVTGTGRILRRFPLVPGVDVSGVVETSDDARFVPGDEVLVTGCGLGESHDGGFSEFVRVPANWVVPLPDGLTLRAAMLLGTAGFTAALAIDRLEQNGLQPGQGPVLVTGASGGVGSIACDLLNGAGYEVVALSRKPDADGYLARLGVSTVINAGIAGRQQKPLETARWAAAIDNVGGEVLAWLMRTMQPWGSIASVGLAGGDKLNTTVMPFILRGVSILGITSSNCPLPRRRKIWQRLVTDLRPQHLEHILAGEISLPDVLTVSEQLLTGQHCGRYLVRLA